MEHAVSPITMHQNENVITPSVVPLKATLCKTYTPDVTNVAHHIMVVFSSLFSLKTIT